MPVSERKGFEDHRPLRRTANSRPSGLTTATHVCDDDCDCTNEVLISAFKLQIKRFCPPVKGHSNEYGSSKSRFVTEGQSGPFFFISC